MADIEIRNHHAAISSCENILNVNNNALANSQMLEDCLNSISQQWESTGIDKESFVTELRKQVSNLQTVNKAVTQLATTVKYYVERNQQTSQKSSK